MITIVPENATFCMMELFATEKCDANLVVLTSRSWQVSLD